MSFETYHYGGYQPEGPPKNPSNPPKSENGVFKLVDSLVEETLLDRIEVIEKRLLALENKQPVYAPPPVYGPVPHICPVCGQTLYGAGFHSCPGPGAYEGIWENK